MPPKVLVQRGSDERISKRVAAPALFQDADLQRAIQRVEERSGTDRWLKRTGAGLEHA
jgi:hypothetical protein